MSPRQAFLLLADLAVLAGALLASFLIRLPDSPEAAGGLQAILEERTGATGLFILTSLFSLYLFGAYERRRDWRSLRGYASLLAAVAVAAALQAFAYYATGTWRFGRGLFALQLGLLHAGTALVRVLVGLAADRFPLRRRVLVVGTGPAAKAMADVLDPRHPEYELVACVEPDGKPAEDVLSGRPVLPRPASLRALVEEKNIDLVVVAMTEIDDRHADLVRDILACKVAGVPVQDMPVVFKRLTGRVPIFHVEHHWFLFGAGFDIPSRPVLRNFLRLVDMGFAFVGLVGFLPLWILVGLLVRLTSKGPALYRQVRLGQGKRTYTLYKFRTMRTDAEKDGAKWAAAGDDPRVTLLGRFLRRSRLDEIPQLWNVLKGEMSLIGPRPERPEFVEGLEKEVPFYDLRFAVPPGLTGWAQVNFRYGASVEDTAMKLQYDLYYVQENSVLLNLHILLKTVQTVLFRSGS